MACSHGSVLPGDGGDFGNWSDFEICPENEAVCGIRTLGDHCFTNKDSIQLNHNFS